MTDDAPRRRAAARRPAGRQDRGRPPRNRAMTWWSTRHEITVDGAPLRYTVTAGRMVLRAEQRRRRGSSTAARPRPRCSSSPTPWTTPTRPAAPVTFAFNGGPGSSSVWLHLGLLGPRRVLMGDAGELAPPPYGLADNAQTLLRHSDLVFIDPVSTGFSRAVDGRQAGRVPRVHRRHRVGRRGDPAVDHPQRPVDVAQVPVRGVLRDDPGGRAGPAPAGAVRACTSTA